MKPAMQESSVVLPQPEAPSATTKSPGSRPRLTLDSARVVRPEVPAYLTLTLRISSLLKRGLPVTQQPARLPRRGAMREQKRVISSIVRVPVAAAGGGYGAQDQ